MLPSSGYFRGIPCPDKLRGACTRPYCHFRHDVKVCTEKNVSSSSSSSQAAVVVSVQEEVDAEEEDKQGDLEHQIMSKELSECSSDSLTPVINTSSEAEQQQEPVTVTAPGEVPKSEILQQLMSEALKKVLAENPTLASTVDASSIRIGIDHVTQESPEVNKSKKQLYHRPPDTPSYNPTPIRELKKRKQSVDGIHNLVYNPTYSTVTEDKGSGDEGGMLGEFSSNESEEAEEKNDDFDLLEEVLAEHSKNNKVKVRKKKVKELGKLQYSLSNTHQKKVDNNIMIADAKKLTDKEIKRYELPPSESVNKIITDGPYFLPPSPIFTSSSDGFEAFSARLTHQEEEISGIEPASDKPPSHVESVKTNSQSTSEKKTSPKPTTDLLKSSSKPESARKVTKASGHTHLPQLLSAREPPKLSRPNIRTWTPLVRNNIQSSDAQKSNDQLDEILQLMDGSDPSSKEEVKETEPKPPNKRESGSARPKKKYKVDLNKEIESLSNPALEHSKESAPPDDEANDQQPEQDEDENSDEKHSTKEESAPEDKCLEVKEKKATKKPTKDSEEKEQTDESEAASGDSEDSEDDALSEESDDSEYKRSRHRKKRKRKRSRSSSSGSDYSRHRRKKRKRSHKRHHKRSKRSRKRRDSTSSLNDESQESEEEREEKKNDDDEEDDDENDEIVNEEEEEEEDEEEEKENRSKEDSESEDEENSDDDIKKSKKRRKKHRYSKKLKHKRNKHKARRKRKRSKSYSRSRSTGKSRDSSRSESGSRSSSKHKKKRNRSRNYSDSEDRDSTKETSRSRSSSRSSSKHKKRRESREDDSSGSRHRESSKSKDKRVDEEGSKVRKEDQRRRDRSNSKSEQQTNDDKRSKNHHEEEISIPMPIDPSKIKVEKNTLVPDLSKVKIEKEDPVPEKSNGQVSVKESAKPKENSSKRQSESSQHKVAGKIHEPRSSTEDKNRRRKSHERKDSTESTSDKAPHRRQSCDSKASDNEGSLHRKKTEERRSSTEKNKRTSSISSQPSEMSMFDLVLASAEIPKPTKTLTEISIFDSVAKAGTNHSLEASGEKVTQHGTKNKSKDVSHKSSGGESALSSEHKSSSSDKTSKSSRSEKTPHTDSHHKHSKSDSRSSHSSSKSKSSSSCSSNHQSSSSSTHKRSSSTSSRSSTSKHHSTTTIPTTTTTTTTTTTSSSSSKASNGSSSSSRSKKPSDPTNIKSEKESSRHTSTSSRKHSTSSNKHHDSSSSSRRTSSSSSKHKGSKESTTETTKGTEGSDASKKRTVSADEDSHGGVSDDMSSGGDSPLPDLSMLDEISQDDWEQMISGLDGANANQGHSDGDEVDTDNPWVLEECMKMFNEFQPNENHLDNQVLPKKIKVASEDKEPAKTYSKQRVARSSSTGNLVPRKSSKSRHQKTTPMQMMVERYQKLKEQLKMKDKQLHHLQGGPSSVSSSSSSKTSVPASSSASSSHHKPSPSQSSSGKSKKRIAHVPNVNSLLTAHEKIKKTQPSPSRRISAKVAKASGVIPETTAHTVAKGAKRVAHLPKLGALSRPIIQPELGSLVPQNIRQRYLNALIDECKKFASERDSFNIAAAEERVCYKRAPSRMVYLNLVVNAVKRLRTQQQAGEEAQEMMDKDPQLAEKMCIEECNASTTKPTPVSPPSSTRPHPTNPNHVQLSHTSVLTAGGIRGSWSIEKPKKAVSQEALKGYNFYKNLSKYILSEEQLEENGYPCPDPDEKGKAIVKKIDTRKKISPSALERYCGRCSVLYTVDKWGFPKNVSPCIYHWGRAYKKRKYGTFDTSYSCCGGDQGSGGCSQATTHVSENYNPKNLRGYVRTITKDSSSSNKEVYALDCEMCYTTEGNELTRITVINCSGDVVYEQLVKPENPILDYNTRFSGITESDMEDVKITIRDVQAALLGRFSDKTILIGHSLESDLHALKIIHATVVDTSVVFPHKMGPPYKRALKNLAAEYLKRIIQDDGHDSAEDAIACLHLMQWKVKEDLKGFSK